MKKYIKYSLIIIVVMIFSMIPSSLFADTYKNYFPIIITDTSGVARTNVPILTGLSGQGLINSNYVNSSATDTAMKLYNTGTVADTDEPYNMDTAEIPIVIPSLPANGSVEFDLYTGYSPVKTSFPIIVGNGGKVTTPYNAALELGNDWEIDVNTPTTPTYIDTSDVGAYILNKAGEVTIKVTADKEITATVYDGSPESIVMTSINSGDYYMVLTLSSGALSFTCDYTNSTPVGTVVNNTNNWIWDSDGLVMPYINSITIKKYSSVSSYVYEDVQSGDTDSVVQIDPSDMDLTGLSWTFPTGYTAYPHSICTDGAFVYIVGSNGTNTEVFKINTTLMTSAGSLTYSGEQITQRWTGEGQVMCIDGSKLFLISPSGTGVPVDEIDTGSMTVIGGGEIANQAICCSDGYLYGLGAGGELSGIDKYSESDLSTLVAGVGVPNTTCDICCVGGTVLYARRVSSGGVWAYSASTLSSLGILTSDSDDGGTALETDINNNLLWIYHNGAGSNALTGAVWSYNGSNISIGFQQSVVGGGGGKGYAMCSDGTDFYITDDGGADQVRLSDMTILNSLSESGVSYNITVSAAGSSGLVEVLQYQPNTIISGTTLPDLSGNGHKGTITWGTNSDITIGTGLPNSAQPVVYNPNNGASNAKGGSQLPSGGQGYQLPQVVMPANWYGGTYSTGTVTVTNGSPNVTGLGTSWSSNMEGKWLQSADGRLYLVLTVTDVTHLILNSNYTGGTLSGQLYSVSNLPNLPLYGVFAGASQSSGMPVNTLYFLIMTLVAFGAFFFSVIKTHSIMLSGAVFVGLLAMESGTGVVAGWIPYVMGIGVIGILFLARQIG